MGPPGAERGVTPTAWHAGRPGTRAASLGARFCSEDDCVLVAGCVGLRRCEPVTGLTRQAPGSCQHPHHSTESGEGRGVERWFLAQESLRPFLSAPSPNPFFSDCHHCHRHPPHHS